MQYVNFGSAGVKVSPIALGLGLRGQSSADDAQRLIEHAIDSGVNLIDCANMYRLLDSSSEDRVRSEEILGKVLRARRDDLVITSKVHSRVGDGPNDSGASRYHIMREVERSLGRLATDRIDVYLLHAFPADSPLEETLRALDDLVSQGKVRYIGCCNFAAWEVCKALWTQDRLKLDPLICVQNPYSLLHRSLEEEMFGLLRDQGLGMMAYSPLAVGLLSGAYSPGGTPPPGSPWSRWEPGKLKSALSDDVVAVLEAVRDIAAERGKSPAQVALNWVLSHPEVTVVISGSDTTEQMDDNLGAVGWELSEEELATLDLASAGRKKVDQ